MILARWMLVIGVALFAYSLVLVGQAMPWLAVGVLILACAYIAKSGGRGLTTLGSARWADAADVSRAGMLNASSGIILGRLDDNRRSLIPALKALISPRVDSMTACRHFLASLRGRLGNQLVKLVTAVHTAIFCPTGGGKGVSIVVPFLETCTDSCVVPDFKGELAKLTADKRRAMGHDVRILDFWGVVTGKTDRLNPLASIDKDSPNAIDECRALANEAVVRAAEQKDPHWCDSAEAWIAAFAAAVVYDAEPEDRSLQTVRTLLSNPAKMEATIKFMQETPQAWGGMLARMGHQLTRFKGEELGSVLTTINRFLNFLDSIPVADNTKESTFDPADLVRRKMTVYLVLPPEHVRAQQALLRLWIGTMLRACVKGGLQERNLVHFVLDEAATLGPMSAIDDAVDKYRGYGVRLIFMYQSIAQLKKCFPEGQDQTVLSNCTQVFFGSADRDTCQYVSDMLGEKTIVVNSGGRTKGSTHQLAGPPSESRSYQGADNWGQQIRRLLKPEEVRNLPPRTAITFTPGLPPLKSTLIRYYEENLSPAGLGLREKASILGRSLFILLIGIGTLGWVNENVAHKGMIWANSAPRFPAWGLNLPPVVTPRQFGTSVTRTNLRNESRAPAKPKTNRQSSALRSPPPVTPRQFQQTTNPPMAPHATGRIEGRPIRRPYYDPRSRCWRE